MTEFIRFLAPFFAPLPLVLLCLFLALFSLLFRLHKMAVFSLLMTLCLFIVFGYGLPARSYLETLERKFPPLDIEKIADTEQRKIRFVVVSGSANITDPAIPESNQLDTASLYRLVEGIRIQRQLQQTFLILSGGSNQDPRANAVVAGRIAESLGVPSDRIVIEKRSHDTLEEAQLLQPMLKDMPFILVSSAAHMEQAMQLFQEAGTNPIAAPTDFSIKNNGQLTSSSFVPTYENFGLSQQMAHAWAAQTWNTITNLIQ